MLRCVELLTHRCLEGIEVDVRTRELVVCAVRPCHLRSGPQTPGACNSCTVATASNAYIEEVRGDEPEIAAMLRIEERELEAGGLN